MTDFELALKTAAERSILKIVTDGGWVAPDYANRFKLPADFLAGVWAMVDQDKIRAKFVARLEDELVDRIVNHMAAEIATDIKQILSVKERREALRHVARQHVESVMNAKPGDAA